MFIQEVAMIHYLNGKYPHHFSQLYGFELESETMLLKFYAAGSLKDFCKSPNKRWCKSFIVFVLEDIAASLKAMHSEGLAH